MNKPLFLTTLILVGFTTFFLPAAHAEVPKDHYKKFIRVDLTKQRVELIEDGRVRFKSRISTGRPGKATPTGTFSVSNKHKDWISTIYDLPMPYFLRLNGGPIGLHAGYVPRFPASAGCIRIPMGRAKKLFGMVSVGTKVVIYGKAPMEKYHEARKRTSSAASSSGGHSSGRGANNWRANDF